MKINFAYHEDLPTSYTPGSVYFVESEGTIYVAVSETEVKKFTDYEELLTKQDVIEDLETIRQGASIAQNISVIDNTDIDNMFELNN